VFPMTPSVVRAGQSARKTSKTANAAPHTIVA
jgi:hypothetical protein